MDLIRNVTHREFVELLINHNRSLALGRVLSLVEAAGCGSIVVEESPSESEYDEERKAFYGDVLAVDSEATPTRIHFFEGDVPSLDEIKEHDSRYLGYCDLRPTPQRTICGALIDQRVFVTTNTDYLFLVCQREFQVLLPNGCPLTVCAFPYVQQDGSVVRCAQAALASIARFYGSDLTGPAFTQIGKSYPSGSRAVPSPGLRAQQIGMGIEKLDYEPIIYDFTEVPQEYKDGLHAEQIIYRYVESGIPVLIGVDAGQALHALVVIGHTFTPDSWLAQTRTAYYDQPKTGWTYHCSTNWIERFVVQDDNLGPYMLAPSDFIQYFACKLVVIPLPPKIFLQAEEAEAFAASLLCPAEHDIAATLDYFIDEHEKNEQPRDEDTKFWYAEFREQIRRQDLVLRTSLMSRDDWLQHLAESEIYADLEGIVAELVWPDHVWVVEISWPDIFVHGRRCVGEIVLDSTAVISKAIPTLEQAWLWVHAPGVILHRNGKTGEMGGSVLQGRDMPRTHRRTTGK